MSNPHENLIAWQQSMELVKDIYKLTSSFPTNQKFGLVAQMQRSAISIPSNIAEGSAGRSRKQFRNFLSVSIGSLAELHTQIEISRILGYVNNDQANTVKTKIDRVKALTYGLRKSLA